VSYAFYNPSTIPFREGDGWEDMKFEKHMDQKGVAFNSSFPVVGTTTDRKPNYARGNMGEMDYSFSSLVERKQLLNTITWTTAQPQGTILDSRAAPYECIGRTSIPPFSQFMFWKGTIVIYAQVQSTAFACGKLMLVFAPFCTPQRAAVLQLTSLSSISIAPNASLLAGNSTQVSMRIPYAHYKNYLDTAGMVGDPFGLLGTLSLVVFNPLRTGVDGQDFCTVNIYSSFEDTSFQIPRAPPSNGNVFPLFEKHGGAISGLSKNVVGVLNGVTDATNALSSLGSYALDNPNVGVNFMPVINKAAPMMNHASNLQYCNVMDLHPGVQSVGDEKDFSTTVDECSIKYMATKWCFLDTVQVKYDDAEGAILAILPLCPTMKLFNAPLNAVVDETLMGYVAAPFKFWKGGIRFRFEFIATAIHSLRVVVATHYAGTASSVDMDVILAQNASVFEVGGGVTTFEMEVPWRCATQWLEVPLGSASRFKNDLTNDSRYTMGEVSIRLLTRLQTMPSISDQIDCNIYVAMADDVEFSYLGFGVVDLVPVFATGAPLR